MAEFNIPLGNYPTQIFTIPVRSAPRGMEGCEIVIPRCTTATPTIWPDAASLIVVRLDFSLDNQANWVNDYFVSRQSGGIKSKNGVEVTQALMSMYFSPPPTHYRGTLEIINGPIRTSMTFTTLD